MEDLKELQRDDEYCEEIRQAMKHERMKYLYGFQDGVLVKLPQEEKTGSRKKLSPATSRVVVPVKLVPMLVSRAHAGPTGAHIGGSKLMATLIRKYHFRSMQYIISNYVKSCVPCQKSMYTTRARHELGLTTHDDIPRRTWAIDLSTD